MGAQFFSKNLATKSGGATTKPMRRDNTLLQHAPRNKSSGKDTEEMLKKITLPMMIAIAALMSFLTISVQAQAGDYHGSHHRGHDKHYGEKYYDDRHYDYHGKQHAYHGHKHHKPYYKKIVKGHKVYDCKFWSKSHYSCEFSHYKKRHYGKKYHHGKKYYHGKHFSFKFHKKRRRHSKHY
ncbi:MAG: hypothetical protein KTR21_12295 [Rhodobacteraceae bacterium]|nr:hypothetical protein [Paracoccaceae bacterium]